MRARNPSKISTALSRATRDSTMVAKNIQSLGVKSMKRIKSTRRGEGTTRNKTSKNGDLFATQSNLLTMAAQKKEKTAIRSVLEEMISKGEKFDEDEAPPYDFELNIAVVGDSMVGKSTFLDYATKGKVRKPIPRALTGIEFRTTYYIEELALHTREQEATNNPTILLSTQPYVIKIVYWDATSRTDCEETTAHLLRACAGIIYMFDINQKRTFSHISNWLTVIDPLALDTKTGSRKSMRHTRNWGSSIGNLGYGLSTVAARRGLADTRSFAFKMLVGNKTDLLVRGGTRDVQPKEVKKLARRHNLVYYATCATSGKNVEEAVGDMIQEMCSYLEKIPLDVILTKRHILLKGIKVGPQLAARGTFHLPQQHRKRESEMTSTVDWL